MTEKLAHQANKLVGKLQIQIARQHHKECLELQHQTQEYPEECMQRHHCISLYIDELLHECIITLHRNERLTELITS